MMMKRFFLTIANATPLSLLIANAILLTILIDALLWYRATVTGAPGWLFAAGVLSLLVLTLLVNLRRLSPRARPTARSRSRSRSRQPPP